MTERRVLVAGIGNVFHGDDAFGSVVARALATRSVPPGVVVMDVGIRGIDLLHALSDEWDQAILVDAMSRGGPPGTLYVLAPDLPPPASEEHAASLDAHSLDPLRVLSAAHAAGARLGATRVVGCEPGVLDADDIGLSDAVSAAVEPCIELVLALVSGREVQHA